MSKHLRFEFGIPIEIIEPAMVQIVRREIAPVPMKFMHRRPVWFLRRKHFRLRRHLASLSQVARRASRGHVVPARLTAPRAGNHMIKCQIVGAPAILTLKPIPQEHVEPGKRGIECWLNECFERNDARKLHFESWAPNDSVVKRNYVHAIKEHRLDRFLPIPEGERVIAQRLIIRIKHEGRKAIRRRR